MKLIHLTDTHLVLPGRTLFGIDPLARLGLAVADIAAHHADAALTVVTGDLTHWGEPEAYACFRDAMSKLPMPYVALVGNHDRRAACLAALPAAPRTPDGFVQGTRDTDAGRLVFLDTLDETSHAGELCEARLAWLDRTLAGTPKGTPLFLFMHHPPFAIGIHFLDVIALRQHARLAAMLEPYKQRIRHIFVGHVHRPVAGSWHGIACSALPGNNHQVALGLAPDAPDLASHEPPAYGIVLVAPETVVVHTHRYTDDNPRYPGSKPGVSDRDYQLGRFGS